MAFRRRIPRRPLHAPRRPDQEPMGLSSHENGHVDSMTPFAHVDRHPSLNSPYPYPHLSPPLVTTYDLLSRLRVERRSYPGCDCFSLHWLLRAIGLCLGTTWAINEKRGDARSVSIQIGEMNSDSRISIRQKTL